MVLPQNSPTQQIAAHPQKRRISSLLIQTAEDDLHRPTKKLKLGHPAYPPTRFWDSLSKIPLTRNALRELNERNTKASCSSTNLQKLQQRRSNFQHLPAIPQRFARQGGPDLKDLRGVCGDPFTIPLLLTQSSTEYQHTLKTT
jgi:hypothetical protein